MSPWFARLFGLVGGKPSSVKQGPRRKPRPALAVEGLEDRCLLSTLIVSNLNDAGPGSLRAQVAAAASGDTIDISVNGTIVLRNGEIDITKSMSIVGPGANLLTISGNHASRIFEFNPSIRSDRLSISDLTLTDGNAGIRGGGGAVDVEAGALSVTRLQILNNVAGIYGGGIFAVGTLDVADCTITGNRAGTGYGGGAVEADGMATIQNSTISDNSAALGGAIEDYGTIHAVNSTFANNHASDTGGAIEGSYALLEACTISGNFAVFGGGGISFGGNVTLVNSTVASNTSTYDGGGIECSHGQLTIKNSTIALNRSLGSILGGGGGIELVETAPDFVATFGPIHFSAVSSIIAGNSAPNGNDIYSVGAVSAVIYDCLVQDSGGFTLASGSGNNIFGSDPLLGSLTDNGGPTLTMELQAGSPAIGQGSNPDGLLADQRGFSRSFNGAVDIGAVEGHTTGNLTNTTSPMQIAATEGSPGDYTVMTFTDANIAATAADFKVTANWGGSLVGAPTFSIQAVSPGVFSVIAGNLAYREAGTYTPAITLQSSSDGRIVSTNVSFQVAEAVLTDTTAAHAFNAAEGHATGTQVLATFTDANAYARATDFHATVDWGGRVIGTPRVSVVRIGSGWEVIGSATYAAMGTYSAAVRVADDGTELNISATQFVVAGASLRNLTPTTTRFLQPGVPSGAMVVARFSDSNPFAPRSDFSVLIHWGDGTTSNGVIVLVARTATQSIWAVVGSHTYATASAAGASYTATVSILDVDGFGLEIRNSHFAVSSARRHRGFAAFT